MKIRRRIKRTTKQYFLVAFICIIVIGGAAIFTSVIITDQIRDEYQGLLKEADQELKKNQHDVYVAVSDIMAGEIITAENVSKEKVFTSQPDEVCFSDEDFGKAAVVDILTGTQVLKNMFTYNTVSPELREVEYNVIKINSNIISNDTVDVRISYPNGESYVILSKKILKGFMPDTADCFFWLNEEELLRMSAAIVDAGLYPGSSIYVTKYIEPDIQKASAVTYIPSLSILKVLENDPNIVERYSQKLNMELRKGLENRLAESMETDVSTVNWNINKEIGRGDSAAENTDGTIVPSDDPVSQSPFTQTPEPDVSPVGEASKVPDAIPEQAASPASDASPAEVPSTGSEQLNGGNNNDSDLGELGNTSDYFYYVQESAGKGESEYGN